MAEYSTEPGEPKQTPTEPIPTPVSPPIEFNPNSIPPSSTNPDDTL